MADLLEQIDTATGLPGLDGDVACVNPDHDRAAVTVMRACCPGCGFRSRHSYPCCGPCADHLRSQSEPLSCHCGFTAPRGSFWRSVTDL